MPFTDPRLTLNKQLLSLVKGGVVGDQIELDVSVIPYSFFDLLLNPYPYPFLFSVVQTHTARTRAYINVINPHTAV
jgi:hypothetical protein